MDDLEPCPFCGASDPQEVRVFWFYRGLCSVHCGNCGTDGPVRSNEKDAARYWNRRATLKGDEL